LRAGQPPITAAPRYIAVHRDADGTPDGYASYSLGEPGTLAGDADEAVQFGGAGRIDLPQDLGFGSGMTCWAGRPGAGRLEAPRDHRRARHPR
jgi:hypothetical protein